MSIPCKLFSDAGCSIASSPSVDGTQISVNVSSSSRDVRGEPITRPKRLHVDEDGDDNVDGRDEDGRDEGGGGDDWGMQGRQERGEGIWIILASVCM